jgi:hypothetical protein
LGFEHDNLSSTAEPTVEFANMAQKGKCMAHPLEATIREAYGAFGRSDVDGYLRSCAPDFSVKNSGRGAIAGVWRGREGFYELARMAMEVTGGSFREEVEDVLANDHTPLCLRGANSRATDNRESTRPRTCVKFATASWRSAGNNRRICQPSTKLGA